LPNVLKIFTYGITVPGYTILMESRIRHKNGSWRILEGIGKNLLNNPAVAGIVGNCHDVTEHRQAEKELRQKNALLKLLQVIATAANEASTIEEAMRITLDEVCVYTGWPVGHVYFTDSTGELIPTTIWHLENPERFETLRKVTESISFAPGIGFVGRILASGKPEWITDVAKALNFLRARQTKDIGVRTGFGFPVLVGTEVVAVLEFFSPEVIEPDNSLLEVIAQIGTQLGRVVERKQAEEALKENLAQLSKKNRYETIISTVTQSVHKSINLQEVLENAVEVMSKNIDAVDKVSIYQVEGKEAVIKAHRGVPNWYIERAGRIPYPKGLTWKTIIEGKPRYIADVEKDTVIGPAGRELGIKSYLSMPIRSEGKTIGCINVTSFQKNAFDEEELKLLEIVAQQIEVAINNARQAAALRKSEEKFRNLVEHTNDWVWEIDKNGIFTYVSPQVSEILGYEPEEILGKTPFDFMPLDDAKQFAEVIGSFISTQRPFTRLEKTLIHKEGYRVVLETSGTPVFDSQGFLQNYHGIARDITERKRIEEELLKTQKLESLGVLAGGIAHDFNNILTAILGNVSLARMYVKQEDKMIERLAESEKASLRAKDLTQQLLTFARGGAPIKETASIVELIKDSVSFVLSGSNVKCEFSIPNDLWMVEIDEGQMSQVINNLIINAQQAMPEGGIIDVSAENMTVGSEHGLPLKGGRYVKIAIKDHGIGIPKEHLQKIFDPYFTTKQKGSGLGLATSYSIVRKHDGHITVDSELGAGTTFTIYLPASEKEIPTSKDKEEESLLGKGRILVMDDEEVVRGVACEMLRRIGYEVEFARDGTEAIELYKRARESGQPFDAVILDLTVPGGIGGKEAIKRLLEIDPRVKAIVSSGYSNDPVMAKFREYGFRGVIAKPYKIEELSGVLRRIIIRNE
jgi:PAS domain S-box-containing protein